MTGSKVGQGRPGEVVSLGAVSFLNAKPLVEGLQSDPQVRLRYAVPSALGDELAAGRVEAALVPVVDLAGEPPFRPISDACIASDGETLTVRVFSRVPPDRMRHLRVDGDSHTSVVLAKLTWKELFGYIPEIEPLQPSASLTDYEGVLLIGDKVITLRPQGFAFEVDLGAAWRELTGLPFVYAVWATLPQKDPGAVADVLGRSRDVGVARATEIARREGPRAGWPVEIATKYLTEYMSYTLTGRHREGMETFLRKAAEHGLLAGRKEGAA